MPLPAFTLDAPRLARAFVPVERAVRTSKLPCAVLAVAQGGRTVRAEAFAAPAFDGPAIDDDTIFAIASVSKPIAALAAMQAVRDGLLSLHTPLAGQVPYVLPDAHPPITLFHALTHTSGLPDDPWTDALPTGAFGRVQAAARAVPLFAPGTRWRYSTLAYDLVGQAVAHARGMDFGEAQRVGLFAPLGMTRTGYDPRRIALDDVVLPVGMDAVGPYTRQQAADAFIDLALPGGGLWSSASDLLRLGNALLRDYEGRPGADVLLGAPYLRWMTQNHTPGLLADDDAGGTPVPMAHGVGWAKGHHVPGVPGSDEVFEHDGGTGALLWIDPAYALVVVFLTAALDADPLPRTLALQAVYGALRPRERRYVR